MTNRMRGPKFKKPVGARNNLRHGGVETPHINSFNSIYVQLINKKANCKICLFKHKRTQGGLKMKPHAFESLALNGGDLNGSSFGRILFGTVSPRIDRKLSVCLSLV